MVKTSTTSAAGPDTLKILVATDIHLGYGEKDGVQRMDSITSFEEVLKIAKTDAVDFVLLGGDLFHNNKPSRFVLNKCMALLRKYCFNSRPVQFELLSDAANNFGATEFPDVNYNDFNLNVGMPVFSINGNHDDLTGDPPLCAMDFLHTCGLVNYFGKWDGQQPMLEVIPILLRKGETYVALYGFGNIRDERLHRMFSQNKVKFLLPRDTDRPWYKILVLHQNRVKHGETNYIPESFIPDAFDLVIWGHEHCSLIDPVQSSSGKNFFVMQPGSTIATSLCEAEAGDKHVAVVSIQGKDFRSQKVKLQTVRQFYYKEVVLQDIRTLKAGGKKRAQELEDFLKKEVEELLVKAESERLPTQPREPLLRLKIDYSGGFEPISVPRFGAIFAERVANPKDLIMWSKHRDQKDKFSLDVDTVNQLTKTDVATIQIDKLIKDYFSLVKDNKKLLLLSETGLLEAVKEYVEKEETGAIKLLVDKQVDRRRSSLKTARIGAYEDVDRFLSRERDDQKEQTAHNSTDFGDYCVSAAAVDENSHVNTSHSIKQSSSGPFSSMLSSKDSRAKKQTTKTRAKPTSRSKANSVVKGGKQKRSIIDEDTEDDLIDVSD